LVPGLDPDDLPDAGDPDFAPEARPESACVLVFDPSGPVDDRSLPVDASSLPADEPSPLDDEASPLDDEPSPLDDEPSPLDDEPSPLDDEPSPLDDEASPPLEEPSAVPTEVESDAPSPAAFLSMLRVARCASFFAHPEPLKWMAGVLRALRILPPQVSQVVGPFSAIECRTSMRRPQAVQTYS
jgi:hypothetical protein